MDKKALERETEIFYDCCNLVGCSVNLQPFEGFHKAKLSIAKMGDDGEGSSNGETGTKVNPRANNSTKKGKKIKFPGKNNLVGMVKGPNIKDIRKDKKSKPTITSHAFHPAFKLEAFVFTSNDGDDGYIDHMKKSLEGEEGMECSHLDEANFCHLWPRRDPNSGNDILTNQKNKFWCHIAVRYLNGKVSTNESRQEGAKILRHFLLDGKHNKCPPKDISIVDGTDKEDPHALDEFFRDDDVECMMKTDLEEDQLTSTFYSDFPDFAKKIHSGKNTSRHAKSLGFPQNNNICVI